MAAPRSIDRQTFLTFLGQSGLVSDEQLQQIAHRHANQPSGRDVAHALVEDGTLTWFQAARLFEGKAGGFFLGQYRILEQLGRGGMGRVYKAEHLTMKRIVALKVLTAEVLSTERAIELFLHEVHAVARLVHPNIVTAYDANEINRRYFLVLEFVDGPNLDQLVRKQGPLSVGLACDYIKQAATGLQCAHGLGMVHRDIKPSNILVQTRQSGGNAPGLVKISDFGLARLAIPVAGDNTPRATIMTKENMVMGTPDYLSPEQSRNLHKTDIRTDIYSLGCTFYFLLTGSVPFPGGTQLDKLIRHSTENPKPIGERRSGVPVEVCAIVERMMAKKPEDRYATPNDVVTALQPYAVSGPTPWAPAPRSAAMVFDAVSARPGDVSDEELDAMALFASATQGSSPRRRVITPQLRVAKGEWWRRTLTALTTGLCILLSFALLALLLLAMFGR